MSGDNRYPICPSCGREGNSTNSGWGVACKGCLLQWHWSAKDGVYSFHLPEKGFDDNAAGGWTLVPDGCFPVVREEEE